MSYAIGEAAILTVIQTVSGWSSTNSGRAAWKLMNKGYSDHYAILRSGGWTSEYVSLCTKQINYRTAIEVWKRYKDDQTTYTELATHVNDLATGIEPERLLGGAAGVVDATVSMADEPVNMWDKGGGPAWMKWIIYVDWKYQYNVTFTD